MSRKFMFCGKWKSSMTCDGMAIPLSRLSAYFGCLKGTWKLIRRSWTGSGHHNPKSNPADPGFRGHDQPAGAEYASGVPVERTPVCSYQF